MKNQAPNAIKANAVSNRPGSRAARKIRHCLLVFAFVSPLTFAIEPLAPPAPADAASPEFAATRMPTD
jgi:hypothetical protein